MATIVGGLAASHTPSIAFAFDTQKADDPVWAPIFEGFAPVRAWLEEKAPDLLFFVYNDHVTSFFFDHYSSFALGIGETWPVADEGGGPRPLPALNGHAGLARHIATGLVADEFDLSYFQSKGLDHGVFSPLSMMLPHDNGWPVSLVPLQVGVLQFPIPTARRCFALGRSLRRAIQSYPEDLKVAVVGSGGLSHQVSGERAGFNNTNWDMEFLDLLEKDPRKLTELSIADYAKRGGVEGAEVIMWLVMRGALAPNVRKVHQSYCLPSMTATATVIYEDLNAGDDGESPAEHLARSRREFGGVAEIEGSYPFTFDRSIRAYRLNKYLHGIIQPELRGRFLYDREGSYDRGGLTEEEKDMLRRLDWRALLRYGVIFFILEKLAAATGVPNQAIYAAMREESLEDFQKTRNTQVLYSVAGTHEGEGAGEADV
ncbi:gallate dioxygenase [Candidatus Rariloculus sp.]|uniref:gallate dioxygenase n=1 Tax=Candidatus Rariloculus sp. TaxID=3101265 RepID=UPI003D0E5697